MKNKVSNVVKTSDNYNSETIMNNNQVMNYKVSGGVKISNEEMLLNKKNGNTVILVIIRV